MKIKDMPYKRYPVEDIIERLNKTTEAITSARSADEVIAARDAYVKESDELSASTELAYIRWSINTKDEFYKAEKEYYEENLPRTQSAQIAFVKAILNSPFKKEVSAHYPETLFPAYEMSLKTMDENTVELLQRESKYVSEYSQFMSELSVDFEGERIPYTVLKKYMGYGDREKRRAAYNALGAEMEKNSEFLDGIYDKLVKVRTEIARKMGYENFVDLGYYRMNKISYDKKMVEKLRNNVLTDIVPIVSKLLEKRMKHMGIDEMKLYDYDVYFKEGNPEPKLDADGMFKAGREMYHEMSKETGEFIDMMIENDAFDVLSHEGKWSGGYATFINKYSQPFILANFNGSSADVDVLTHEAGHAFAFCATSKHHVDPEIFVGGMETAETHSMSMEFFCWKYIDKFFFERANDYKLMHLFSAMTFLTYGTIVDYFQQLVYENPDMTPVERNATWNKLEKQFRPYMDAEGITYLEKGTRWQYQMHIFESPFYYIDYVIAQSTALQFLIASMKDYSGALNKYFDLANKGGTEFYSELVENEGLQSPFKAGALKTIAEDSEKLLYKLGL